MADSSQRDNHGHSLLTYAIGGSLVIALGLVAILVGVLLGPSMFPTGPVLGTLLFTLVLLVVGVVVQVTGSARTRR